MTTPTTKPAAETLTAATRKVLQGIVGGFFALDPDDEDDASMCHTLHMLGVDFHDSEASVVAHCQRLLTR